MLFNYASTLLLASATGVAAGLAARACNENNCLRAIKASAFTTRHGTADCSSYFRTTVTPAIVTVTATATVLTSTTVPETVVISTFPTVVVTVTQTSTDVKTLTSTAQNKKRQVTSVPSDIPAYASACSGSVKYSSACSCVGVTATTVTAATPTTTVTVSVTNTIASTSLTLTTATFAQTNTVETTAILEITTTTTTTAAPQQTYIPCTGPPFNSAGTGGCSSSCFCDILAGSSDMGFCDNAGGCGGACNTNADCPSGQACTSGHPECGSQNVCLDYTGCSASGSKMMFAIRGSPSLSQRDESPSKIEKSVIQLLRNTNTGIDE